MNKVFQRIYQKQRTLFKPVLHKQLAKHYQAQLMRHQPSQVFSGSYRAQEWVWVESQAKKDSRRLCEYLENRPSLTKKQIIPNGIRTTPLVIPGPALNDFAFEKEQANKSLELMKKSFAKKEH